MSNVFKLIFLLIFFPLLLKSQYYKEHCVSGNCRNGFGVNRVSTSKDPFEKSVSFFGSYHFYEVGNFHKGKLEGRGCRFDTKWNNGNFKYYDEKIKNLLGQNQIMMPDSTWMLWYHSGDYQNGFLEGTGIMIEWNATEMSYVSHFKELKVKRTSSGNFHLGKLHGSAHIVIEYPATFMFDTVTYKESYKKIIPTKIYAGGFENGYCVDCTESILSLSGIWGDTKGKYLNQTLSICWAIKNYEDLSRTKNISSGTVFKTMNPYKILHFGDRVVGYRLRAEQTPFHKVQLPNGIEYYGEIDKYGKPFGFGILNGPEYYYEGEVDKGLPQGTGLYQGKNAYASSIKIGGVFLNGNLESGASFDNLRNKMVIGGWGNSYQSGINLINGEVVNGPYFIHYYTYDPLLYNYKLMREESGYAKNGKVKDVVVYSGLTDAEKQKQRKVINGSVKFSDLVVGDVVIIDGLASVVESISSYAIDLLDKRHITNGFSTAMIQLSSHKLNEFKRTCSLCNGTPIKKYMYTAPPHEVSYTYYKTETIISEYSTQTLRFPQTGTYTKKFEPVERTSYCNQCNTTGTEILKRQIKE